MIKAVGVLVPAHDEQATIGSCLDSVRTALALVPARTQVAVSVVLDRCSDRTPAIVAAKLKGWTPARAVTVTRRPAGTGVGFIRALGARELLERLTPVAPQHIWLLSTDADTVVPRGWVREHLRYASTGVHGVAGLADLDDQSRLTEAAQARYQAILAAGMRGNSHRHVYAANLGVRADAYLRCGGFPAHEHGEERRLWTALTHAGCRLAQPTDLTVITSARTHGRAPGGVADLLHRLHTGIAPPAPSSHDRPTQSSPTMIGPSGHADRLRNQAVPGWDPEATAPRRAVLNPG